MHGSFVGPRWGVWELLGQGGVGGQGGLGWVAGWETTTMLRDDMYINDMYVTPQGRLGQMTFQNQVDVPDIPGVRRTEPHNVLKAPEYNIFHEFNVLRATSNKF